MGLKPVDKKKNPGLAKLPTKVRNKMGYMKKGGIVKKKEGGMVLEIGLRPATEKEMKMAKEMSPDQVIVINLSGRGDKDIHTVAGIDGIEM